VVTQYPQSSNVENHSKPLPEFSILTHTFLLYFCMFPSSKISNLESSRKQSMSIGLVGIQTYGPSELYSCTPRRLMKASVSTEPKSIAQRTIVKIFRFHINFFLSLFILKGTLSKGQFPKTEPLICVLIDFHTVYLTQQISVPCFSQLLFCLFLCR